mgnify:CR=1 FL=1
MSDYIYNVILDGDPEMEEEFQKIKELSQKLRDHTLSITSKVGNAFIDHWKPLLMITFKFENLLDIYTNFEQKSLFAGSWLFIAFIRFFGHNSKYEYSIYHKNFNEKLCWLNINILLTYNIAIRLLDISKIKLKMILQVYLVWKLLLIYISDFTTKIQGMPPIQVKVLNYGWKRLTKREQLKFSEILAKQQAKGMVSHLTEDWFNMLVHHIVMVVLLLFILFLFYICVITFFDFVNPRER